VIGLELATVRNAALVVVLVALGLAVAGAWIVKALVLKLVAVALLVTAAAVVWSERRSLAEGADRIGASLRAGAVDETSCTFLGRGVTISSPLTD
jgi:NADH:ubiquinone oxidoreductase subunit H